MSLTFNSLVELIATYIDRQDKETIDKIPTFISLAEQAIVRKVKTIGLTVYGNGVFIPGNPVYQKPANWRRNISFNYGSGDNFESRKSIELRVYEYLNSYWPDRGITGAPEFYSEYGYYGILVSPTPDKAYPYEWGTYQIPEPLSRFKQTNWITDFAPDVLLYGSLVQASLFSKNYEVVAESWNKQYLDAINDLNAENRMRVDDRQTNRDAD
jgi:hypothetical protein